MKARRHPLRARPASGFTILEVLVAMGILLFGMVAVLGLLTWGAATARTAQLRTSAASAAQAVVLDLEETFFPEQEDGSAGEPLAIRDRALRGAEGVVYSATAVSNPARPTEYRVDVRMSWNTQGVQRELEFSTILLQEIPFGERLRRVASGKPATNGSAAAAPAEASGGAEPAQPVRGTR